MVIIKIWFVFARGKCGIFFLLKLLIFQENKHKWDLLPFVGAIPIFIKERILSGCSNHSPFYLLCPFLYCKCYRWRAQIQEDRFPAALILSRKYISTLITVKIDKTVRSFSNSSYDTMWSLHISIKSQL